MSKLPDSTPKNPVVADEPFIDAKSASALGRFAARTASLIKRGGRAAVIYAASYLAVKALDKAAETHPDNKLVNGADQVANVVFGVESLLVGGAVMMAEAGYDAATKPRIVLPPEEKPTVNDVPAAKEPQHHHRSRANLNAVLTPTTKPALLTNGEQKPLAPVAVPAPKGQEFRP